MLISKRRKLYKSIMKKSNARNVRLSPFSKIPSIIANYWLIFLAVLMIGAAWILVLVEFDSRHLFAIDIDSAKQVFNAVIQELRHYLLQYSKEFNPSMDINNLHVTLSMLSKNKKLPDFAHTTITNFLTNLVTLQAITKFHTSGKLVNASSLLPANLYDDNIIKNVSMRSEVFFYKKFPDDKTYYNCLKSLFKDISVIDYLLINDLNEKDYPGTDFNVVHRLYAVLIEFNLNRYINMSLNNITFYKRFIGVPLTFLVSLWAICLLFGIMVLPVLGTTPLNIVTYLTLTLVSIGILASCITLSLILSSIRNTS
ncbi:MAG: hypothetical protein NTV30_10105 [Chloroflexi bacterium]|nr:hypothetical protein [Chloroflexota bacterium]